jgi:hypothetical protein
MSVPDSLTGHWPAIHGPVIQEDGPDWSMSRYVFVECPTCFAALRVEKQQEHHDWHVALRKSIVLRDALPGV